MSSLQGNSMDFRMCDPSAVLFIVYLFDSAKWLAEAVSGDDANEAFD